MKVQFIDKIIDLEKVYWISAMPEHGTSFEIHFHGLKLEFSVIDYIRSVVAHEDQQALLGQFYGMYQRLVNHWAVSQPSVPTINFNQ